MAINESTLSIESIQLKRGTKAAWSTKNPKLLAGEMGLEMDTRLFKVGDGSKNWNDLTYWNEEQELANVTAIDGGEIVEETPANP